MGIFVGATTTGTIRRICYNGRMRYPRFVRLFVPAAIGLMLLAGAYTLRGERAALPATHFTLSNGLKVVVVEHHRVPAVVHMLLVEAGAGDDPRGKTGLAHYLEHLMFTGTKAYPEGEYDRAISRMGGEQNAHTTKDYTLYYATIARAHLPEVMAMEADRFAQVNFTEEKAARELKVITEERQMRVENNPEAQLMEQLNAITYLNHPYQRPTIGWAEDMAKLTLADAQGFFAAHYNAHNMTLLVVGDVTPEDVRRDAEKYYGNIPAGQVTARHWPEEPPIRLARRGAMEDARVREPRLVRQYLAPSAVAGDTATAMPLAVFTQMLGGGESSLLYETLVKQQHLATAVEAGYDLFTRGPSLVTISATPAPGVRMETLEAALDGALTQAVSTPPAPEALARAKTRLAAEAVFARDGLSGLAMVIAELYAIGLDEQYLTQWPQLIAAVDAKAAQAAAQAVIDPRRAVTGVLRAPEGQVNHAP